MQELAILNFGLGCCIGLCSLNNIPSILNNVRRFGKLKQLAKTYYNVGRREYMILEVLELCEKQSNNSIVSIG
jgi:hypothetical protein